MGLVIFVTDILQGKKVPVDIICLVLGVNIKGRSETVA
jgi:predicted RNA-binding protein with TRAM domain